MASQVALRRQQAQEENEARDLSKQFKVDQLVQELQEKNGLTTMAALQFVTSQQTASAGEGAASAGSARFNSTSATLDSKTKSGERQPEDSYDDDGAELDVGDNHHQLMPEFQPSSSSGKSFLSDDWSCEFYGAHTSSID